MVVKLLASTSETEQDHEFHIEMTGPSAYHAPLGTVRFAVVPGGEVSDEGIPLNLIINMQILAFPEPGPYTLHFSIDDQEIGTAPLTAQQLNPDEINSSSDEQKR
jgi:Family of unknown function (DUF6941)